jgi:osmoprotectant transport system ATP-binding protein
MLMPQARDPAMVKDRSPSIAFQDVSVQFQRKSILSHLNFQINTGDVLVLLGRSGSGKTTTLKLINHLLAPSQGQVWVGDRATTAWDRIQLRRQIGYVIQEVGLFPHFTVGENVSLVPSLSDWAPARIQARVNELLDLVGLDPHVFAQRYPHELSGGQRQRVGVARALAADPPILLMDEPFGALDPITRLELQEQFQALQRQLGKTVVLVTHDIQEGFFLGTRIGLMHEGHLVSLGTQAEFLTSEHPEAQAFMACLRTRNGV